MSRKSNIFTDAAREMIEGSKIVGQNLQLIEEVKAVSENDALVKILLDGKEIKVPPSKIDDFLDHVAGEDIISGEERDSIDAKIEKRKTEKLKNLERSTFTVSIAYEDDLLVMTMGHSDMSCLFDNSGTELFELGDCEKFSIKHLRNGQIIHEAKGENIYKSEAERIYDRFMDLIGVDLE